MSDHQIKALLDAIKTDASLREKLTAAADVDAVVALAHEAGFPVSAEQLQQVQAELSEAELDAVVGGASPFCSNATNVPGIC